MARELPFLIGMYYAMVISIVLAALATCETVGVRHAIWLVWFPSLLLPNSSVLWMGPVELSLPTAAGVVILAFAYLQNPRLQGRWVISDYLVIGLIFVCLFSELMNHGSILGYAEAVRLWGGSYVIGRLALEPTSNGFRLPGYGLKMMALICTAAAGLSIFEGVTHVNPYWELSGNTNFEFLIRYGLRRSSGPSVHPIGFGMFFVSLLPWAVEAARRGWRREGPLWWVVVPLLVAAGLFCTVSRGPWLGAVVFVAVVAFCQLRRIRFYMVAGFGLAVILCSIFFTEVVDGVNALAGNDSGSEVTQINIDGRQYPYTGTNHRYLQFLVYRKLIVKSGLAGFGDQGLRRMARGARGEEFIPELPPKVPSSFYSVDSHYLLFQLWRGWLGIGIWVALALYSAFITARSSSGSDQFARYCVSGGILGLMIGLVTVYSHRPFEECLLFMFGAAATWNRNAPIPFVPVSQELGAPAVREQAVNAAELVHAGDSPVTAYRSAEFQSV